MRTLLPLLLALPAAAGADDDFDPTSEAWNGLSELTEVALALPGVRVDVLPALDWSQADGAVLVVHPLADLGAAAARRFVEGGGRLVVADDHGQGDELLRAFGLVRAAVPVEATERLAGHAGFPVARPVGAHPLVEGVARVVTNHPTGLLGEGTCVATFPGTGVHLAIERRLGEGRVLGISDGSVLINNMLELMDNRRFAENLVRWAVGEDGGRLVVAAGTKRSVEPGPRTPGWSLRIDLDLLDRDLLWLVGLAMFGCALLVLLGLIPGSRETAWRGAGPPTQPILPSALERRLKLLAARSAGGDGRLLAALVGRRARGTFGRMRSPEHAAVTFTRYARRHPRVPGGLAGLASLIQEVEETPPLADARAAGFRRWTLREALRLYHRVRAVQASQLGGDTHGE